MNYDYLGRSGMKVSRLCLGTWNFGSLTDEPEAFRIMDTALDAGINFFDTANHYPDFVNCGRTEEIIGRWFAQGNGRRERVVLATKVSQPMRSTDDGPNDEPGLSRYIIRRHLAGSLRRLNTDHIELYQMHHIDHRTSWDEIWEAFAVPLQQGRISYVGSSNFAGWHLARAQAAAAARGLFGLVSEQHRYNLLCRLPELEVLPAAQAMGIGVLAYSPLAGGLLAGDIANAPSGSRRALMGSAPGHYRDRLASFAKLAADMHETPASLAVSWVLANPAITSAVIGPRTTDQLKRSLRVMDLLLNTGAADQLNRIFPGPGGPAPEAYAW